MKTVSRLLSSLVAFIAVAFAPAVSGEEPRPVVFSGGLTLQLATSAYKVVQPGVPDPAGVAANAIAPRSSFSASAVLANRSNSAITFTFPDGASAAAKFEFTLNDKDGNEVWHSDEGIGVEALTEMTLKRGQVWKRSVRVPLIVDGTALPVGSYTLVAFTDADKQVVAQSLLEIVAPTTVPAKGKINGAVVKVITPATDANPEVTEPAAGAWVSVQQIGDGANALAHPFTWSGYADENGKFAVEVPVGRFRVTAGEGIALAWWGFEGANGAILPPTYPPKSVEVSVAAGQTVDVLIKLTKAADPVVQGIKGLVVALNPLAANPLGEVPVAGARIEVTEIVGNANAAIIGPIHVPFHWTGTTNNEGRFEVRTPVGKFHVVATRSVLAQPNVPGAVGANNFPAGGILLPPESITASADVSVSSGKSSEVKLTFKQTNLPGPIPLNQ